jgi:hypothetical protein
VNLGLIVGRVVAQIEKLGAGLPGSGDAEPGLSRILLTSYGTFLWDLEASIPLAAGAGGIIILGFVLVLRRARFPSNNTNMSKLSPALGVALIAAAMMAAGTSSGWRGWIAGSRREASDFASLTLYQWNLLAKDWYAPPQSQRALAELLKTRPGIAPSSAADLAAPLEISWRRPLWELFYPMVKSRPNLLAAARVAACYLSQFKPEVGVETVSGRWLGGRGPVRVPVSRLYAAALRALAVPARETGGGGVELWTDGGWTSAPALKTFDFVEL